jgi:hypothetical protein
MNDIDLDEAFGTIVRQLPHKRWRNACAFLARQKHSGSQGQSTKNISTRIEADSWRALPT